MIRIPVPGPRSVGPLLLAALLVSPTAGAQSEVDTLLSAVVGVRAEVPENARTAAILGTARSGSGVVIDGNGLVATVGYLILEATRTFVAPRPGDAPEVPADVVAYDHDTGIGLLRARAPLEVTPMALGDSAPLTRGTPVMIASYGGPGMARPALVVDRRDFAGYWEYLLERAVFASPPHPLFGGAALIDAHGNLVGIGSLIVNDAAGPGDPVAGNVFIPVDLLTATLAELLTEGRAVSRIRPWLGLYTEDTDGRLLVTRLADDGPAMRAGVRTGEIVSAVDGTAVESMIGFYRRLWDGRRAGDTFTLTLSSAEGTTREVRITSMDRYDWLRLR